MPSFSFAVQNKVLYFTKKKGEEEMFLEDIIPFWGVTDTLALVTSTLGFKAKVDPWFTRLLTCMQRLMRELLISLQPFTYIQALVGHEPEIKEPEEEII